MRGSSLFPSIFVFALTLGLSTTDARASNPEDLLRTRFEAYRNQFWPQAFDGPNCYQASAYLMGWQSTLRYVSAEEFLAILDQETNAGQCRELGEQEQSSPLDLGMIFRKTVSENSTESGFEAIHAFVWENTLANPSLYSKLGSYNSWNLERADFATFHRWFALDPSCYGGSRSGPCSTVYLRRFRCMAETLPRLPHFEMETRVERAIMNPDLPERALLALEAELTALEAHGLTADPLDRIRWESLRAQLTIFRDPD